MSTPEPVRRDRNADISLSHQTQVDIGELELTILMPCLDEAKTVRICIAKAQRFLESRGVAGEVLIADNGSTDGSIELARSSGAQLISVAKKGYGAALAAGIEAAHGKFVIMGDADDSYDFTDLDRFLGRLRDGYDLVMGDRFRGGIERGAMPPLHYYLGNPILSFIGRLFFRIPIHDFHCGLRGFRRSAIRELQLQTTGMEFASEMIVRSALKELRIAEVPTTLKLDGRGRASHLKTWRDGWRHLKFLLMYSPRWLFFYPGIAITSLGALLSTMLIWGPVSIGGVVVLDLNTFLAGCLLTVIGVQLITFGALARYYAAITGMLPSGRHGARILRWCRTDRFLQIAAMLIFLGVVIFGICFVAWARVDFGNLSDSRIPRFVAAGLSLTIIGIQTGFAGFLFGIFDIPRKGKS
ncbi:family 2 glycosyl transferase [Hyphomicrobium denitrificans 1NES1]|uniref:Family 2 glycosyl transferase n=1 Tax=Hyphomicrobium denitrificans 1NES1 TaxID=670307 RepID=N0B3W4_9HYPH|nr:glycosyltransferase family 2 protein [Hyphomicrobium denitrificans]AGK56887.1 family 2 glycosyl transferase [Hyphomicrobium denitrificans 1NES1]